MLFTRSTVLALTAAVISSVAQTRSSAIGAGRDMKKMALQPEVNSSLEHALLEVKERHVMERLNQGLNGFSFHMGGMATGSGFAVGPHFIRDDLAGGRFRINASASVSSRSWQKYEFGVAAPHLAGDRLSIGIDAGRRDYRSLDFYGSGPNSKQQARSAYRHEDTFVEGIAVLQPLSRVRVGSSLGGLWVNVGRSTRDEFAATETLFNDLSAPGLSAQTKFVRSSIFGQFDLRDNPEGPRSGGNYASEYAWYKDQSLGTFSFRRWDVSIEQYIACFNKTRRLALRARMSTTDADSGSRVPFYLQPRLGGGDDLRGFRPHRFTDRNALVYNAEYRWEVFSGLDGAVFVDAGKVMPKRSHLAMNDLEVSPGFGLRFNARNRTFLRVDVGFSHEGVGFWLKFNDAFVSRLFGISSRQPVY